MNGLENKLELFGKILDTLPNSIYIKDLNGRYVWLNKASIKQLEYKHLIAGSIIGKTDFDVFPKASAIEYSKNDKIVINTDKGVCTEEDIILPNNKRLTQLSFKEPLYNELSEKVGVLGYTIDITEVKKSQIALEKTKYQLKGAQLVTASIAHEIRTPLATTKASIGLVKNIVEKLCNNIKENKVEIPNIIEKDLITLKEYIDLVNKKTDQCNSIINMLLAKLQSFESGISDFDYFFAVDCIEDSMEEFVIQEPYIAQIKFDKKNDFKILGNKTMVKHIIMNFLKNSFYFIQKSKKGMIVIWLENKAEKNEIHFKDTASGISKEILPLIFEPFFTTETSTGTGVGLAFSKMVMESHQGNITCLSEEGEYTEFILDFPKIN